MTEQDKQNEITLGNRGLVLQDLNSMQRFAQMVLASNMAPKAYKVGSPTQQIANICVAVQYGLELGLTPMQSLHGVAVINGRPTVWGDALLGLCYASGKVESFEETVEGGGDNRGATCKVKREGVNNPIIRTFSIAMAKKANLWGKHGPWTQYPDRMLQNRARSFALRDAFADILRGVISAEEARDIPNDEPRDVEVIETPVVKMTDEDQARMDWVNGDASNEETKEED